MKLTLKGQSNCYLKNMKFPESQKRIRVIPKLDIKGPNLVKGINFEGLRVLGKPEKFAEEHYKDGADEIIYIDIVASLYGRNNLLSIVEKTAKNIFIPLTAGGGVRTTDDIRALLRAGADKVSINTAAINNPRLISEAAMMFGSQCVVLSIEAKKEANGKYEAYTDNGREKTGIDVFEWAKKAESLGAGELFVTSVDRDGTGKGYDIDLFSKITGIVSIPVIASGGCGKKEHMAEVALKSGVDGVCAASIFNYGRMDATNSGLFGQGEGNIEFLTKSAGTKKFLGGRILPASVRDVKDFFSKNGLLCRMAGKERNFLQKQRPETGTDITVAIIDYGMGNIFSLKNAIESFGAKTIVAAEAKEIKMADGIILPGVGAFSDGMRGIKERGFEEAIKLEILKGKPLFGICLGMQILMEEGEEFGKHSGLGLIGGKVAPLPKPGDKKSSYKIPHVGWNNISVKKGTEIFNGISEKDCFYFDHSYAAIPADPENIIATTPHGDGFFCSAVEKNNVYGFQFHPEKSGAAGLQCIKNMINLIDKHKNKNGKTYNTRGC